MDKALGPFAPYTYAIMRIVVGLLFVSHGGQKLFGWFGGPASQGGHINCGSFLLCACADAAMAGEVGTSIRPLTF